MAGTIGPRASGPDPDPAPPRQLIFGIVSLALLMASIDQTIVATALPTLQHDLHARINWAGWTITVYSLGRVLVLPLVGRFSDQYGRRPIFIGAVCVFTAASLCCGLATDIYFLIAVRAVQAFGGAAFMPSATGMVSDLFGADRDRAIGLFTSINPIGAIIGPILGGVFVTYWSWRGIFLVNVPIGVVLIALAWRFIPSRSTTVCVGTRPDLIGMALLAVGVLGAMIGATLLGERGASVRSVTFVAPEAIAVLALGLFARHTARASAPFIPPILLRGHGFGLMNIINFLYGAAALGFAALVPLYATQRYGIRSLASGTLLTARGVGIILVAALAALALRRTGYRWPMAVGFTITAVGLLAMASTPRDLSPYAWLAAGAALTGVGMGLATPASNNASLQLAPEHVAAIAGLRTMFRQAGAISAISLTTAILPRSHDPGLAQAHIFEIFAVVLVATLPLIRLVPEHRGSW